MWAVGQYLQISPLIILQFVIKTDIWVYMWLGIIVTIVIGLQVEDRITGARFPPVKDFLFSTAYRWALEPTQLPLQWVLEVFPGDGMARNRSWLFIYSKNRVCMNIDFCSLICIYCLR
jgi:hypothetical protein